MCYAAHMGWHVILDNTGASHHEYRGVVFGLLWAVADIVVADASAAVVSLGDCYAAARLPRPGTAGTSYVTSCLLVVEPVMVDANQLDGSSCYTRPRVACDEGVIVMIVNIRDLLLRKPRHPFCYSVRSTSILDGPVPDRLRRYRVQ